jgi:hypothetical protein
MAGRYTHDEHTHQGRTARYTAAYHEYTCLESSYLPSPPTFSRLPVSVRNPSMLIISIRVISILEVSTLGMSRVSPMPTYYKYTYNECTYNWRTDTVSASGEVLREGPRNRRISSEIRPWLGSWHRGAPAL